jgi:hypothetical protein
LTSMAGFLILFAMMVFIALMYKSIKFNSWRSFFQQSPYSLVDEHYLLSQIEIGFIKRSEYFIFCFCFCLV